MPYKNKADKAARDKARRQEKRAKRLAYLSSDEYRTQVLENGEYAPIKARLSALSAIIKDPGTTPSTKISAMRLIGQLLREYEKQYPTQDPETVKSKDPNGHPPIRRDRLRLMLELCQENNDAQGVSPMPPPVVPL